MDTPITKLLGTTMTIEFHNLPLREMELFKNCFVNILEMKPKLIFPGQLIIHFDKEGNVLKLYVSGLVYRRKKI